MSARANVGSSRPRPVDVLLAQGAVVLAVAPAFYLAGLWLPGRDAFVVSFLFSWAAQLLMGTALVVRKPARAALVSGLLATRGRPALASLAFLPAAATLFLVFIPSSAEIAPAVLLLVVGIALINGMVEELFWRGITASEYGDSALMLAISTTVFAIFHFLFLLLPLEYDGGWPNLVGGSASMGALWLLVTVKGRTLAFPVVAHQLVNVFAFSGLAVMNGWRA